MSEQVTTARQSHAIRKAAILISTLDTKTADALLDRMTPEQQAQVRQAVMELSEIRPTEQDHVIREFIGGGATDAEQSEGVELDLSLARKLQRPELYEKPATTRVKSPPFQGLRDASAEAIARQLERQHPQVAAVVVAHLPARRAAELVQRLGPKLQSDVLRRVAELDQADPEVIREIEEELEQLLSGEIRAARNRHAGLSTVSAILEAAGEDRTALMDNLVAHDREFAQLLGDSVAAPIRQPKSIPAKIESGSPFASRADLIKFSQAVGSPAERKDVEVTVHAARSRQRANQQPGTIVNSTIESTADRRNSSPKRTSESREKPALQAEFEARAKPSSRQPIGNQIGFEELSHLADDAWATLIRALDPEIVLLALAGASESFIGRITSQLPPRESDNLRRRLEKMGPIRLDDIDRAQHHVARQATEFVAEGKIQLPQHRRFAAAA